MSDFRDYFGRYGAVIVEALALGAVAWAMVFQSVLWPVADAVVFGALSAGICVWAGGRLLKYEV